MKVRERATDLAYAGGWGAVRWMPEGTARSLFRAIADRTSERDGDSVRQLRRNLARVQPALDPAELDALVREAMRRYLRYWREAFRLPSLASEEIVASFHVPAGGDLLTETLASGRGVVVSLPHMGNWDHAGAWFALEHGGFTTVAERLKPEALYERFLAYRESLGMEVLPLTGGPRVLPILTQRLRAGGLVALLGDRDLTKHGIPVQFFGAEATMPAGPAALALSTGAALIPATLWHEDDRTCCIFHPEVVPPAKGTRGERIAATVQAVADVFESAIAEHPADWHMLQALWTEDLDARTRSDRVTDS